MKLWRLAVWYNYSWHLASKV